MPFNKCFPCLQYQNEEIVTRLDCSNTVLTDVFPDVWQYERTLEELYLTSTRINNLPPQLFYCQSLRVLVVNNNNLETVPNAIGSLRQLQYLNLSRNLISNVPDNIKACKNLTRLDLSYNNLQRLPDAITCLISLQELLLNETYLEFLPANFGRLVHLKILELRLNNLMTLPKSISRLSNLQRLDIGGNEFTSLPDVIGELKQLRELWFDFNQIRCITPNIAKLRELQHLEANGNLIELLPNEISHWRNVEVLSICTNSLQSFPFSVGMLKTLITLKCESNGLRELPDSISNLENLEELVLSHNRLLRLPSTIGMLKKLRFIFVDDNQLRELPDEICNCSNLSVLSVSRNQLTELPQNIGHLRKLKVFNIVNNYISTLPVSVLGLVNLTSLWISDNQSQPLVPLQYLDMYTKTELTCFMLPQQNYVACVPTKQLQHQAGQGDVSNYQLEQDPGDDNFGMNFCQNMGAKRICFADEATIVDTNQLQYDKNSAISDNTSVTLEEQLGVRLMRSPTPYPKELRLMAKYVRQSRQKVPQTASESKSMNIKETSVMPNMDSTTSNCDTIVNVLENYEVQSQISANANGNCNEFLDPSSSKVCVTDVPNSDIYGISQYHHTQQEKHQHQLLQQQPHMISQLQSLPSAEGIGHNQIHQLSQQNANIVPEHAYVQQQFFYPILNQNSSINNSNNFDSSNDSNPTNCTVTPEELRISQNSSYILNNQHQFAMEPPPYHIARIFTKKSPKDLTSYETMRNLHKQGALTNRSDAASMNSFDNQNELPISNAIEVHNERNLSPITFCDNQNISNITNSIKDIDVTDPAEDSFQMQQLRSQRQQSNMTSSSVSMSNDSINLSNNVSTNSIADKARGKKTQWLFGVHKNPTVKQVVLKWEDPIGFDIECTDNQEGIYVSSIAGNTNAARLLSINDKLLEIDGYDVTNISLNAARDILKKAGPVMNIMLSRK